MTNRCNCKNINGDRCKRHTTTGNLCFQHKKCKDVLTPVKKSKQKSTNKKCPLGKIMGDHGRCVNRHGRIGKAIIARRYTVTTTNKHIGDALILPKPTNMDDWIADNENIGNALILPKLTNTDDWIADDKLPKPTNKLPKLTNVDDWIADDNLPKPTKSEHIWGHGKIIIKNFRYYNSDEDSNHILNKEYHALVKRYANIKPGQLKMKTLPAGSIIYRQTKENTRLQKSAWFYASKPLEAHVRFYAAQLQYNWMHTFKLQSPITFVDLSDKNTVGRIFNDDRNIIHCQTVDWFRFQRKQKK